MAEYTLSVTTGAMKYAGTIDNIYVILFGTEGQSEHTNLDNFGIDFRTGTASSNLSGDFFNRPIRLEHNVGLLILSFYFQDRHTHT